MKHFYQLKVFDLKKLECVQWIDYVQNHEETRPKRLPFNQGTILYSNFKDGFQLWIYDDNINFIIYFINLKIFSGFIY